VPAPVLSEVCRGSRLDAAVNALLNRDAILVAELTREIAQRAGGLLAQARMSSEDAIDAFVVATALEFNAAVIASGDTGDLARLAAPYPHVSLMQL
jgi:predicted nucleic acid-binding protein